MIFYVLVGLAICALSYTYITASDYTIIPDDPDMEPYVVDVVPLMALLAAVIAACVTYSIRGLASDPLVVMVVFVSYVVCGLFGVLWFLAGQYPAVITAVCIAATATLLLPRTIAVLRGARPFT